MLKNNAIPTELRYVSPIFLEPGSIIPPGNFGKNVMSHAPGRTDGWAMARELIMEQARLMIARHLPSRMYCSFLFTSDVAAFHGSLALNPGMLAPCIYKVELVDPEAPWCLGDFDTIRTIEANRFFESATQAARTYWINACTGNLREDCLPEFLTLSPIRIVKGISVPNHGHLFPTINIDPAKGSSNQAPGAAE